MILNSNWYLRKVEEAVVMVSQKSEAALASANRPNDVVVPEVTA